LAAIFVVACWSISNNAAGFLKALSIDRAELQFVTFDPFSLGTDFCL
jgi:hypothetical protein